MIYNDITTLQGLKQDLYFKAKINSGTYDQNDLNRIINNYYKKVQMAIRSVNEDFYAVPTTANLASGQYGQYSWPTDMEKIKFIELALSPTNLSAPTRAEYQRATIITSDQRTNNAYAFTAPTVIAYGDYYEVANNVAAPVTKGIRMVYIPYLASLVNDTDVPNIYPEHQDIIVWGAIMDMAPRLNNDELLVRATQMYEKGIKAIENNVSSRIQDMAGGIVEGQSNEGGWSFPFGNNGGFW